MDVNLTQHEALQSVRLKLLQRTNEIEAKHGLAAAFWFRTIVAEAFEGHSTASASHSVPGSIRT